MYQRGENSPHPTSSTHLWLPKRGNVANAAPRGAASSHSWSILPALLRFLESRDRVRAPGRAPVHLRRRRRVEQYQNMHPGLIPCKRLMIRCEPVLGNSRFVGSITCVAGLMMEDPATLLAPLKTVDEETATEPLPPRTPNLPSSAKASLTGSTPTPSISCTLRSPDSAHAPSPCVCAPPAARPPRARAACAELGRLSRSFNVADGRGSLALALAMRPSLTLPTVAPFRLFVSDAPSFSCTWIQTSLVGAVRVKAPGKFVGAHDRRGLDRAWTPCRDAPTRCRPPRTRPLCCALRAAGRCVQTSAPNVGDEEHATLRAAPVPLWQRIRPATPDLDEAQRGGSTCQGVRLPHSLWRRGALVSARHSTCARAARREARGRARREQPRSPSAAGAGGPAPRRPRPRPHPSPWRARFALSSPFAPLSLFEKVEN